MVYHGVIGPRTLLRLAENMENKTVKSLKEESHRKEDQKGKTKRKKMRQMKWWVQCGDQFF